jgi:hypothetical protein
LAHCAAHSVASRIDRSPELDGSRPTGHHSAYLDQKEALSMPDKGPGSKGGAKKPKGGKAATASKNGKK